MDILFVDPSGIAKTDDGEIVGRVCLGNQFVTGSLYSTNPILTKWVSLEYLNQQVNLVSTIKDDEIKGRVYDNILGNRDCLDMDNVILFPAVNKQIFERGWNMKGLVGGRNSTKSYSTVDYILLRSIKDPIRVLCTRDTEKSIKDTVRATLMGRIKALGLEEYFNWTRENITTTNGSYFSYIGMSRNEDAIKSSFEYDICWIEEGQSVSKTSYDFLVPTILRNPHAEIICSWNRLSPLSPVDMNFFVDKDDDDLLIISSYKDNPWLAWSTYKLIEKHKKRDIAHYNYHWGGGLQTRSDAQIFHNYKQLTQDESAEIDKRIEEDPSLVPWYGFDYGTTSPSAMIEVYKIDEETLYVSNERYQRRVRIRDMMAFLYGDDKRWSNDNEWKGIPQAKDYPIMCDWAGGGAAVLEEMNLYGINGERAHKPHNSIELGVAKLQNYDILISDRCPNTKTEFDHYAYKVNKDTDEVLEKILDEHNHLIDALRYAIQLEDNDIGLGMRVGYRDHEEEYIGLESWII